MFRSLTNGLTPLSRTALLAGSLLLTAAGAQAQYVAATTPDMAATGGNAANVLNTGNAEAPLKGYVLRAMCWDGDKPGLAWDYKLAGVVYKVNLTNANGPVEDPDVVMDAGGINDASTANTNTTTQTLVTYLAAGHVYVEVWRFDPVTSTATRVRNATRIDTGTGLCTSPNVDANRYGQAVVVFEQGGLIKARPISISGTNNGVIGVGPANITAPQAGFTYSEPDVAVFRTSYSANPADAWASFVYLEDNGSGKVVKARQVLYPSVGTSAQIGSGTLVYPLTGANVNETPSSPRIAAPWEMNVFGVKDFQIVFQNISQTPTSTLYNIIGATAYAQTNKKLDPSSSSSPNSLRIDTLNSDAGINASKWHDRPVVSYAGDNIITAWAEWDYAGSFDYNIVARRQGFDGTLFTSPTPYSYVNKTPTGFQLYPSISGRFSAYGTGVSQLATTQGYADAFYSFYDENASDILYKNSYYGNSSLRGTAAPAAASVAPSTKLDVYPNPAHAGQATVTFGLAEREQALSLEVFDRLGRNVQTLPVQALSTGTHQLRLDGASLKPGVYMVRLRTSSGPARTFRLAVD